MASLIIRAFISYNTPDREFADRLSDALKPYDIVSFVDHAFILAGEDWTDRLTEEIISANIILVVLSPGSVKSKWVRRECKFAESNGIPIIPVMYSAVPLPLWLIEKQYADFQSNFTNGFKVLLSALRPETMSTQQFTLPTQQRTDFPMTGPSLASAAGDAALSNQAISETVSHLQKPLTSEQVQQVQLSREFRIEEEKKRLASEQQANSIRFFVSAGLGISRGLLDFGTFWTLAGVGSGLGIVTQNSTWALLSIPILAILFYSAGFRKAMSLSTFVVVALVSAALVYLLMRYVPTLPYAQTFTTQLPFLGQRTVYLGREIFAGLVAGVGGVLFYEVIVIFSSANWLSRQYEGIYSAVFTMGGFGGPIIAPFIWVLSGFAVIFNWGFGFVPNLGYGLLSLFIGIVPGIVASSGLALGVAVVVEAQRDKTRIERKATWDVLRAEWQEKESK